jgi:type I thyroxine 5'-deiodinase
MAERYADRALFRTVYIKEAHPEDEWQMDVNVEDDVCYAQPRTFDDRLRIARDFAQRFDYGIPLFVDGIDDAAKALYSGWPERLYVIGADGRIAYKGEPGPFGFHPEEVEDWLRAHPPPAGDSLR